MRDGFSFDLPEVRVRLGPGARHAAAEEAARLGLERVLVVSTPGRSAAADALAGTLGDRCAGVFAGAAMHTPVEVTAEAMAVVADRRIDGVVALGGGSAVGLGKAIAYRTDMPQIVIPTTYSGSEATAVVGQTEDGVKTTVKHPSILPEVILYDPELVASLPPRLTAVSGLNAMAHAVEALYARDANPLSTMMAAEGIRRFAAGLPLVMAAPEDLSARGETLYAAWLCGAVLGQVGMSLHHKLCHTLGGSFGLPHAETHAIVLPHAAAYNAAAAGAALGPVTEILGGGAPGRALRDFAASVGAPVALRDLGLAEDDLDRAAEIATRNPYWNPAPVDRAGIRALLARAWAGETPAG